MRRTQCGRVGEGTLLSNDGVFGERPGMGRGLGRRWPDIWELRHSGDIWKKYSLGTVLLGHISKRV